MERGIFKELINSDSYKNLEKEWKIVIDNSELIWLNNDLKINQNECLETYLKILKEQVERNLPKKFIYFIASRKKVRFYNKKKPSYSFINKNLILYVVIGNDKRKIKVSIYNENNEKIMPKCELLSEKEIIFYSKNYGDRYYNIHDFLIEFNINLGFDTEINYVGITKEPENRPIKKAHRGLSDVLLNINDKKEEKDIFIIYNLFKVFSDTRNLNLPISYLISNSMSDEINIEKEGAIIENSLIMYFDCKSQKLNKKKEYGRLLNLLKKDMKEKNINKFSFNFDFTNESEYFNFINEKGECCRYFEIYENKGEILIDRIYK